MNFSHGHYRAIVFDFPELVFTDSYLWSRKIRQQSPVGRSRSEPASEHWVSPSPTHSPVKRKNRIWEYIQHHASPPFIWNVSFLQCYVRAGRLPQGKQSTNGDTLKELTRPLVDQSPSSNLSLSHGHLSEFSVTGCLSWCEPAAD